MKNNLLGNQGSTELYGQNDEPQEDIKLNNSNDSSVAELQAGTLEDFNIDTGFIST
jgi:hypothetical protein